MTAPRLTPPDELRNQRRQRQHQCWNHLIVAPLWPKYGVNLGTLLRTCDATGACMAVPKRPWIRSALEHGNTLRTRPCVHWTGSNVENWLTNQKDRGTTIVGVELTNQSIRIADLPAARNRTVIVLGHEREGIPPEGLDLLDVAVEIPMIGSGSSLNVAVAGSLVLYKLAGLL